MPFANSAQGVHFAWDRMNHQAQVWVLGKRYRSPADSCRSSPHRSDWFVLKSIGELEVP